MVFDGPGTYVQTDAAFTSNRTLEWNHDSARSSPPCSTRAAVKDG
jgi:hypothetical protein